MQATFGEAQKESRKQSQKLCRESTTLERQIRIDNEETRRLRICGVHHEAITDGLADLDERVRKARRRVNETQQELERLEANAITGNEVSLALADFDSLWETSAVLASRRS